VHSQQHQPCYNFAKSKIIAKLTAMRNSDSQMNHSVFKAKFLCHLKESIGGLIHQD